MKINRKFTAVLAIVALMTVLAACGNKAENNTSEPPVNQEQNVETNDQTADAVEQKAEYTVTNATNDVVTELYLYEVGADKGENLAGDGLADGASIVLTRTASSEEEAKSKVYVLEFVSGGQTQAFETLHFEVAPICLKSVDAAAGATPIAFVEPQKAEYTVYNTTGDVVTELYLYEVGADKGTNLAGDGLADGASIVLNKAAASEEEAGSKVYVLEFVSGGQTQAFETLHFEVAPISLKSVDAAAGATPISFTQPE